MKVSDIIALAQLQAEEIYEDPTWIKYINLALDDLTPVVKLLTKKTGITVTWTSGSASIVIANDTDLAKAHEFLFVYVVKSTTTLQLRRLPLSDNVSDGWKLTMTEIALQNTGGVTGDTVRVDYYRKLLPVATTGDDVETVSGLPAQYHQLLIMYCVAKSQQKEEELNDKNDAYAEYLLGKQQLALERVWAMEPHMRKYIKRARIAALIGGGGGGGEA